MVKVGGRDADRVLLTREPRRSWWARTAGGAPYWFLALTALILAGCGIVIGLVIAGVLRPFL
jgi:hypothetical protein